MTTALAFLEMLAHVAQDLRQILCILAANGHLLIFFYVEFDTAQLYVYYLLCFFALLPSKRDLLLDALIFFQHELQQICRLSPHSIFIKQLIC